MKFQKRFNLKKINCKVKNIDLNKVASVQEMPVQSCIVESSKKDNNLKIKGFAYSGGMKFHQKSAQNQS